MGITINIDKAKKIWKDKIRNARKLKLEELDIQYIRALESSADTSDIVTKKQELRDFPAQVDSATTTDEIKAVWEDPDFDKDEKAFYYVRVLENPSCPWRIWDAIKAGKKPRPDLAEPFQERHA